MAQTVKRLSTMRETRVRSLGREDPLEKEMAIHSSTIAWKIPWTEEPGRLHTVHVVSKSRTLLSDFTFLRRRNMSSSRTYYCDIIIGTEFKEKHILEEEGLLLWPSW